MAYNGWTNQETWKVALEVLSDLSNEEDWSAVEGQRISRITLRTGLRR